MESTNLFFKLIEYCNIKAHNTSEYAISKCIIYHIGDNNLLSMEQLSKEAHISQASIHRFIKRVGFSTYEEFKMVLSQIPHHIQTCRKMYNLNAFHSDYNEAPKKLYNSALLNLENTWSGLNIEKLKNISNILKNARNVTLLGDDHALSIFYTLQLDLIINHVPTIMYKSTELQAYHTQTLDENSIVLFFNVSSDFIREEEYYILKNAEKNNSTLILFSQDTSDTKQEFLSMFDIIYEYGTRGSLNSGYFSLLYLSSILCEFIYIS